MSEPSKEALQAVREWWLAPGSDPGEGLSALARLLRRLPGSGPRGEGGAMTAKCPDCDQPMLRKGQKRKHPDDYRHAQGCSKPKPRKDTRLAGLLSAAAKIKRVQVSKLMSWAAAGGMECAHSVVLGLIRAERRRKRGRR